MHLLGQELQVGAGSQRHDLELLRLLAHDIQRLRADGAGAAQKGEPLRPPQQHKSLASRGVATNHRVTHIITSFNIFNV